MQIEIVERLRPFSHKPGIFCFLPNSFLKVQVFPAKIKIFNISTTTPQLTSELNVNITGPVKDFTVQLDLEKGFIKVWGHASEGFFRYIIKASTDSYKYEITIEKSPVDILIDSPEACQQASLSKPQHFEHLSLGVSKKQEWQHIWERISLAEILPFLFRAGQLLPENIAPTYAGTSSLLSTLEETISAKTLIQTQIALSTLFMAGFEGMIAPRLEDDDYQGFKLPSISAQETGCPLFLISKGAQIIRSLFVEQSKNKLNILTNLLPQLQCGRMTNIRCEGIGILDLEWRKNSIRRIVLNAVNDNEIHFNFRKDIKIYRIREGKVEKKVEAQDVIEVFAGKEYLLDNFK